MADQKADTFEVDDKQSCPPAVGEQQMRKQFSIWSLASVCLCLMATWEALGSVVAAGLAGGGAPCVFYNYLLSLVGSILVAASLGEISSIYPTAGGQYHWVAMLAPKHLSRSPSWYTAWISIGGLIVLTASSAFAAGLQYRALISITTPDYAPQPWHGLLFYWLILAYSLLLNLYGSKYLAGVNLWSGILHIVGFFAILITLSVMAPKQSAAFVFTETSNETGWSENGIAWLVGLVSTVYPFLGYDCAAHLSEEMSNPARDVPLAMVGSVVLNGLLGLAYCIVLLFSLSDLETLLTTTTGFPFVQLFINVTKSQPGAIILTLIPTLIATAANAAGLISTSRTAWALARDSGFPFPKYFSKIDDHLLVPKRMILCISFLQMLLGFIYLGSVTAFNAILSMSIFGVYLSYLLPIGYMLFFGRKDKQLHPPGPFSMGRFGAAVNVVAILWLLLALVFSTFPGVRPVTPQNMNYCIVVMAGWFVFGVVYYVIWGSKTYFGPCIDLEGIALARERSNAR